MYASCSGQAVGVHLAASSHAPRHAGAQRHVVGAMTRRKIAVVSAGLRLAHRIPTRACGAAATACPARATGATPATDSAGSAGIAAASARTRATVAFLPGFAVVGAALGALARPGAETLLRRAG